MKRGQAGASGDPHGTTTANVIQLTIDSGIDQRPQEVMSLNSV